MKILRTMTDYSDNFHKCLKDGQDFEHTMCEFFGVDFLGGKTKDFDIVIPCECKNDIMCEKTGNIAIEYRYKGQPSGISLGNGIICYQYNNKRGFLSKQKLRQYIKDNQTKLKFVKGGDGNFSELCLIKEQIFDTLVYSF